MSEPREGTASGGIPLRPSHEPADVPAELDPSRRPRRRPPRQSEIRGINTIASLPEPPPGADGPDDDGPDDDGPGRDDPYRDDPSGAGRSRRSPGRAPRSRRGGAAGS